MNEVALPKGALAVYDEAEKGILEVHPAPIAVAALGLVNMKLDEDDKPNFISTEVVPVTRLPAKKKKVSKWILWTLWFNTYRCVSIMSSSRISNPASGLIR
jgi:hypothetical protein